MIKKDLEATRVCGLCKWHCYDPEDEEFFCDCSDADEYTDFTPYDYTCEEWEKK